MTPDLTLDTLVKVTAADGSSMHGGRGRWTRGRWRSVEPPLVPCERGLHVVTVRQAVLWLGPRIGVVEVAGERIDQWDKVVVERARVTEWLTTWDERSASLFAADCAERALPVFERERPDDDRPRRAIETARAHARGEATDEAAARAAAWDAARAAALDAAWAAAWDAARYAARYAAWAAARAAAWAAELAAARAATRAAAWDAALAAARDAAWSADAGAAEREWQAERLLAYLRGEA